MGVPSLNKLLKECPEAVEKISNEMLQARFAGQTFLFEASGMMHRFVNKCDSIANNEHLQCFIKLWTHLRELGIESAFVFDGATTAAKQAEITRRTAVKKRTMERAREKVQEYQQEIQVLETKTAVATTSDGLRPPGPEETPILEVPVMPPQTPPERGEGAEGAEITTQVEPEKKYSAPDDGPGGLDMAEIVRLAMLRNQLAVEEKKATRKVSGEYYVQLKELFRLHGVPFMTARYEAEQAASWLVKHGLANVVVSDDYDCLLCGAPQFFQHFHSNKKYCEQRMVKLEPLLKHLNFTHEQFIDYCILVGTDFGGHLPGIGPAAAQKIIKKHGNIDAFLDSSEGRKYRKHVESGEFDHKLARLMFADDGTFPLDTVEIPDATITAPEIVSSLFHQIRDAWSKSQTLFSLTPRAQTTTPTTNTGGNAADSNSPPPSAVKKKVVRSRAPKVGSPRNRYLGAIVNDLDLSASATSMAGDMGDEDEEMKQTSPPKRARMINL